MNLSRTHVLSSLSALGQQLPTANVLVGRQCCSYTEVDSYIQCTHGYSSLVWFLAPSHVHVLHAYNYVNMGMGW